MSEPGTSSAIYSDTDKAQLNRVFFKLAPEERIKVAAGTEQRLYELACEARAKGMFRRIPPCHPNARKVADEIADLVKLGNREMGEKDLGPVHGAIKALNEVEVEELKKFPGYTRIMSILRKEFQNYTFLSHQRGLEEKGEIFQLIAHFPIIGIYLRRINIDRLCRYDGVFPDIPRCTHSTRSFYTWQEIRLGKDKIIKCKKCQEEIIVAAVQDLWLMDDLLVQEDKNNTTSVDASIRPTEFEKDFKITKEMVVNTTSADYVAPIDALRKLWNLDIANIEGRETFFENRIRQQRLIAKHNLYHKQGAGEELDKVMEKIDEIAASIRQKDVETKECLEEVHGSFSGSWARVRRGLNSESFLPGAATTIAELTAQVKALTKENEIVKTLLSEQLGVSPEELEENLQQPPEKKMKRAAEIKQEFRRKQREKRTERAKNDLREIKVEPIEDDELGSGSEFEDDANDEDYHEPSTSAYVKKRYR